MKSARTWLFFILAVIVLMLRWKMSLDAAPSQALEKTVRINVPADRPDVWFAETKSLVAVPRDEFEQLLKNSEQEPAGPKPAQLSSAQYTATLAGQALRNGRAQLAVQKIGKKNSLMPLGQFNLAVRDLKWTDRPAIWGTDDTGQGWLLADVASGEIEMNWSAAGRTVAGELNFDLQFPAAAHSVLDVRVPRDQELRSTPEARRIEEGSDAAWQVWRVYLGSDRRCRMTAGPSRPKAERPPVILFEHELGAIVREQDLRFQTVFQVEVFDSPVSELTFTIPSSVDVYAVTLGQEIPLSWSRAGKAEAAGTLTIHLPGPLLGRSRPIRIDGVAQKPSAAMISPQIAIKDGIFVGGRHTLTIVAPLQLRSFRPSGFRQLTPATTTPEGESYTFQQLLPDAQLVLEVGRPQASLNAQVHCVFEANESAWALTSELTWIASSGGVFQTECQFPSEWEITDVRLASELGTARLAGWDASTQAGGHALLTVEFLEELAPTVPRTIRVLARRRPQGTGTAFPLPLPHPSNCYSVESTLGLILPSTYSPFVSDDARLERTTPPDDAFTSTLRPRRLAANQNEFWYRRETTDGGGSLQLVSRLRRVAASGETQIAASSAEYTEQYRISCQAEGAPLDRLLVYLTQSGSDIRWSIRAPRQGELVAQRMPLSQHSDWNLPQSGELWELRLPPVSTGAIQIEGHRGNRWLPSSRPALLVIPQSIDRKSYVTLRYPAAIDLNVESNLLDAMPAQPAAVLPADAAAEADPASAIAALTNERSQKWSFENPAAQLSLTMNNPEESREFPIMVSMRLRSLLSANPQGFDLYRAQIRLENGTARDQLRIQLPEAAIVQQVTVGGEATVPNHQGREMLLTDLDTRQRDVIEVLYRVPSAGGNVRNLHRIVVPQVSALVLGFAWEFALPPSVRIFNEPPGVRLTRPLPVAAWTERIFGPLGRPADELFFNPIDAQSWRELFKTSHHTTAAVGEMSRELVAPAEWQTHESISAVVPTEILLETWQTRQTRLLSWISLIASLMLGIILRMIGWKYRDRVAAYWLASLAAGASFSPAPYAEILGGAIAGTVIALLSPRRSLLTTRKDVSQSVPLGSTRSFDWGAAVSLVLISVLSVAGFAQDQVTTVAPVTTPAANRTVILVPVDASGKPSETLKLVYVSPQLLSSLRAAVKTRPSTPRSIISSASYAVSASPGGTDSLVAKFRAHLLQPAQEQQILLPISHSFLTGIDACRINGIATPARNSADGNGFVIPWSPSLMGSVDVDVASIDIELDLKRVGLRTSFGGSFVIKVPIVADSRWELGLPEAVSYFDVMGIQGATEIAADRKTCQFDAGSGGRVEVRWSQKPPEPRAQRLEVSQLQFLDLRPTMAELKFRMRCDPVDSEFDFIDLEVPARTLIREGDIRSASLLRTELLAGPSGSSRLRVIFSETQRQKFTIDGSIQITAAEGTTNWQLPQFGVFRNPGLKISVAQNWWSVAAPLEFRLEHQNLDVDQLGIVSASEFLQAWGESPPLGRLQVIFPPREGTAPLFTVTPHIPRRRVLSWEQKGLVGRRRLEWTVKARLEASQAPVYQHFLLVDRRLQIDSISVTEGGAERFVRWSENRGTSPTRVVLFLRDKTTGTQLLTLKGSLPTRYGRTVPLPFVRYEEAELVSSSWELSHEPDVEVDLTLPRGVPPFEPGEESDAGNGRQTVARYQTADPDPKTSIRVSAVQAHCVARIAAALVRGDGANWRLTGEMKLTPEGESPRRMGVHFPSEIDPARVRVDRAEANWHEPSDGHRRLDLTLLPDPGEVLISFDAALEAPSKGDWALPLPVPQEATSQQIHLLLAPPDAWTPLEGTELKPDELPNWAAEVLSELRPETGATEYHLEQIPVRLRRNQTTAHVDQPEIRLLDHSIWLAERGEHLGLSRVYLSQTRDTIQFEVPEGVSLLALFLDERPLPLPVIDHGKLTIPIIGGARESVLAIRWQLSHSLPSGLIRAESEQLPKPVNIDVLKTLMTVVSNRDALTVGRDKSNTLDWMGAALDRIEMLLARQESLGNDPRAASANRRLIFELQAQITARIPRAISNPSAQFKAHLDRWSRIVASLNLLEPLTPQQYPVGLDSRPLQVAESFGDLPQALRVAVPANEPIVNFWLIDRRWIHGVGGLLLCLILIPIFRKLIRLDWGEWLNARTTVAWLLLGIVWWLWLTPGPVGPLIIVTATLRALQQKRRSQNSVMVLPSS